MLLFWLPYIWSHPNGSLLAYVLAFLGMFHLQPQVWQYPTGYPFRPILNYKHAWRVQLPGLPEFWPGGPSNAQMINIWSRSDISLGTRPSENRKEGLRDRLGQKCTAPRMQASSNWFMIACLRMFIGNTNCNLLVWFKETENKWDLLVREVVGAQISSYWAHRRLEVPQIKWVQTNNSIHSGRYTSTPAYLPDPPSDFPRVWFWD